MPIELRDIWESNGGLKMKVSTLALALVVSAATLSATPRALPEGEFPKDKRLGDLKDLNGYFPFKPPASKKEWAGRSAKIRQALRVSAGLFPEPDRTPLNGSPVGGAVFLLPNSISLIGIGGATLSE